MFIKADNTLPDLTPTYMTGTAGGHSWTVTHDAVLRDGKPCVMKMGEIHFSRVPQKDWERELTKMKKGGIDIAASYVFWNHHENTEGNFDFTGNRDIRLFADTCEKVGMPFFLRIGPWAHGEARNGGFPDWLIKKNLPLRSTDKTYISHVRRLFEKIYDQLKDSQNIVGIQVDNELTNNPGYLSMLKDILQEIGFTAPIWSATAWGRAKLPEDLQPMFGGYPEAPWEGHTRKLGPNANYFFSHVREDGVIGEDLLGQASGEPLTDPYRGRYPFLTCELGGGNQNTYHRRPLFIPEDLTALAICKLGSGANGLGYYMYHGGVNPTERDENGKLITFEESRESGYPNDCPVVSYDFEAPLGDCGQTRDSYFALADLHRFVDACGESLAVMRPAFPDEMPKDLNDTDTPRVAVRSDGISGFVFYNNHVHADTLAEKKLDLTIGLNDGDITIPMTLPAGGCGVFPFMFRIGSEIVRYITAMPVAIGEELVEFIPLRGVEPVVCFADGTVKALSTVDEIGGVKVKLGAPMTAEKTPLTRLDVRMVPCVLCFEAFRHLRRLDGSSLTDHTVEYEVIVPENAETLCVRVYGNVAAAYSMDCEPVLLNDHFCDGDVWCIDVRGVRTARIKVQPLAEEDCGTIYFECNMPAGVIPPEVWASDCVPVL